MAKRVDKYAYLAATLRRFKENGYNLNIPRYVDTFRGRGRDRFDGSASGAAKAFEGAARAVGSDEMIGIFAGVGI